MSRLRSDTAVYGLAQAAERAISFFLLPVLAKAIPPAEYAIWAQSVVTAGVMTPILLLGFQTALVKYLPLWESDPARKHSLLLAMMVCVLAMIGFIAALLIGFDEQAASLIYGQPGHFGYIPVLIGLMASEALFEFLVGILRANGLIRRIAFYMFLKGIWRIGIFLTVLHGSGAGFYHAFAAFVVIQIILIWVMYLRDLPVRSLLVAGLSAGRRQWGEVLVFSLPLVALGLLTALNNFTDRFFLAHLQGLDELAVYSAAYSLAAIASFFYSVLGFTLFPALSRRWVEGSLEQSGQLVSRVLQVYLFLLVPFIAGLSIVGPTLMRMLATEAYSAPPHLLLTLGCSIGFFGLYQIAFFVTLLGYGSLRGLPLMAVAAGMNVMLNAILVPSYGATGAAIAGCTSNATLAVLTLRLARQVLPWQFSWAAVVSILLRALCMAGFLVLAGIWPGYGDVAYLLAVSCAAALLYLVLDRVDRRNSILNLLKSS